MLVGNAPVCPGAPSFVKQHRLWILFPWSTENQYHFLAITQLRKCQRRIPGKIRTAGWGMLKVHL